MTRCSNTRNLKHIYRHTRNKGVKKKLWKKKFLQLYRTSDN